MTINWETAALLFPGQGSQGVGMGKEMAENYPVAKATFEEANDILQYDLAEMCFSGPEESLNDTVHTQPAMFVAGIAVLRALNTHYEVPPAPKFAAGHSLGEFTALVAAGALTFEDGLRLVHQRASLMKAAGEEAPGAVAALLGLEIDEVREVCEGSQQATGGIVVVANDNCPGQVVISGDETALDHALNLAQERGAKRAVKLPVSVAVHSPLMQSANEAFAAAVNETPITAPAVPVIANTSAQAMTTVEAIREELTGQLTGSVRWTESIQTMLAAGADTFIEVGPGGVLKGLMRRIDRNATSLAIENPADIQKLAGE